MARPCRILQIGLPPNCEYEFIPLNSDLNAITHCSVGTAWIVIKKIFISFIWNVENENCTSVSNGSRSINDRTGFFIPLMAYVAFVKLWDRDPILLHQGIL